MIDKAMMDFMEKFLRSKGFNPETANIKFTADNRKLGDIITMSLPAGHSCPFAKDCRSCTVRNPRKRHDIGDNRKYIIRDGPFARFRCYTAIDEAMKPDVRAARWWNFLVLQVACMRGVKHTAKLIESSLPEAPPWGGPPVRPHVAGDFFRQTYFDAWLEVARRNPHRLFYAYTKALPFWVRRLGRIPNNFRLTASRGGTHDHLIEQYNLKSVHVVSSVQEARSKGLPLDHDDSHAYGTGGDFALLVHGQQPKGTLMAKAWSALKRLGMGGYGKHKAGMVAAAGS